MRILLPLDMGRDAGRSPAATVLRAKVVLGYPAREIPGGETGHVAEARRTTG